METHTKHTHRYIYICSTCVYSRQLHTHISEVHFSLIKCNFPKMHLFPSESFSWNRDTPPPTHRHTHSVYVHVNTGMICNLSLSLPALMINCLSNIVFLSLCVCVCLRACVLITQVCMPLFFGLSAWTPNECFWERRPGILHACACVRVYFSHAESPEPSSRSIWRQTLTSPDASVWLCLFLCVSVCSPHLLSFSLTCYLITRCFSRSDFTEGRI